jgi:predicted molibdopterin-dependent oxidoreductase YjgC
LPAAAGVLESEGTVTSSERRVQRVRPTVPAPYGVRGDVEIIFDLARRLGHDWGTPDAESIWNEVRSLSPMHGGMSYRRLEEMGGIQWPCYDESHPGEMFLHGRLWSEPLIGPRAPFHVVEFEPPVDQLDEEYPIRLTTGRRLDDYNTGVQTRRYSSPLRREEALQLSPEDGQHYKLREGENVRVSSRRGSLVAPVRFDSALRPGLAFLSVHAHDRVATNDLTIDAVDPKSGTSEFKATAIRIEKA